MTHEHANTEVLSGSSNVVASEDKQVRGLIAIGVCAGVLVGASITMIGSRYFPFLGALPGGVIGLLLGCIAWFLDAKNPRPGLREYLFRAIASVLMIGLLAGGLVFVGCLVRGGVERITTPVGDGVIRD